MFTAKPILLWFNFRCRLGYVVIVNVNCVFPNCSVFNTTSRRLGLRENLKNSERDMCEDAYDIAQKLVTCVTIDVADFLDD